MNSHITKYIILYLICAVTIIFPLFNTGFNGDDTLNSLVHANLRLNHEGVFEKYIANFNYWKSSRVLVVQMYYFVFLITGGSLLALKLYVAILVLACLYMFSIIVKEITKSNDLAALSLLCFLAMIQFRDYGDPILAFHGITPLSLFFILLSVYYLIRLFKEHNRSNLIIANLALIFSTQLYEYNIIIVFILYLIFLVFIKYDFRKLVKAFYPSLIIISSFIIISLYFRFNADISHTQEKFHESYVVSNDIYKISNTFLISLKSSLPLANIYYKYDDFKFYLFNNLVYYSLIFPIFLLLPFIFFKKYQNIKNTFCKNILWILFFALIMISVPTLLISLSPKYQLELKPGLVYTNGFYVSFGYSIFLLILIYIFLIGKTKYSKLLRFSTILVLFIIVFLNYLNNMQVVDKVNTFWKNPRKLAEDSMKFGIFKNLSKNPIIISAVNYPWSIAPFYNQYSGIVPNQKFYQAAPGMFFTSKRDDRNILIDDKGSYINSYNIVGQFIGLSKFFKFYDGEFYHFEIPDGENINFLDYKSIGGKQGYAISCKIRKLSVNQNSINGVYCGDTSIYYENDFEDNLNPSITFNYINNAEGRFNVASSSIGSEVYSTIKKSKNKLLLNFNDKNKNILLDPYSIVISPFSINNFYSSIITSSLTNDKYFEIKGHTTFNNNYAQFAGTLNSKHYLIDIKFSLNSTLNAFQKEFSHIIGNHPGRGFDGFVFQKKYLSNDSYVLSYGNGTNWIELFTINLNDTKIHNLRLEINEKNLSAQIDGGHISNVSDFSSSPMPIQIGGLSSGSRAFIGIIHDIKIKVLD